MGQVFILANQATAAKRRVYFHLVDATDGITAETGEAGGQPQVSSDGAAFTNTGIGTLTHIGNGRYYADLTQTLVQTAGVEIETRYKSANTAECFGDSVRVVAIDVDTAWLAPTVAGRTLAVAETTGAVTAGTVSDKTGYSLSTAGVQAIWDALSSALTTVGSIGERIVDYLTAEVAPASTALSSNVWTNTKAGYLDAAVSSVGGTTPPTVTQIRQEMDANSTKLAYLTGPAALEATLTAIKGAGWSSTTDTLEAVRDLIAGLTSLASTLANSTVLTAAGETISFYRGNDHSVTGTVSIGGVAQNISGYSIHLTAKRRITQEDFDIDLTGTITSGPAGTYSFTFAQATTEGLDPGKYAYDVEVISGAGAKTTVAKGELNLLANVRHPAP